MMDKDSDAAALASAAAAAAAGVITTTTMVKDRKDLKVVKEPQVGDSDTDKDKDKDSKDKDKEDEDEDGDGDGLDEDEARPEATFQFKVQGFSKVKESVLSSTCQVRNLPWKIMIMPRPSTGGGGGSTAGAGSGPAPAAKSMGYFLQCNGESEAASWSCQAQAELRVLCTKDEGDHFSRRISHLFYSKENDWGFSHYMSWNEMQDPEKGYVKDDTVTFEVKVSADAPHGVCWDSKKHTGYVGLKNQGATCYMNSLLQVLYFTSSLRRSVYKMPTEADDSTKSVGLALQRVFHDLQFNDKAVGTKKLTKSFGWETLDSFMQHDVQEFLRVLLDKLEMKMKGTCVEGQIPRLFEGKMVSYIRCKNVDYTSSRTESFYDVQLSIKGKKNIVESFRDYIQTENLDGENKYDAGEHGHQDAEKGIVFTSFPPILHLHLMRFHYDPVTDGSVKFNDRFEFPNELDLAEFLKKPPSKDGTDEEMNAEDEAMEVDSTEEQKQNGHLAKSEEQDPSTYLLHAVLVHSGDNHGGHYVVFINPKCDGKWCKFDDDVVSRCTEKEAIQNNFGGADDDCGTRQSTNAYMLVYVRKSQLKDNILCEVKETDIPTALVERLSDERKLEVARRKEKSEAHLYMTIRILTEDNFQGHQGNDLYDCDKVRYQEVRVKKADTLKEVLETFSEQTKFPPEQLRIWPMTHRTNQTLRPSLIDIEAEIERGIYEVADQVNPWTVFLEMESPDSRLGKLPTFDKDQDVMLFFKYYDPEQEKIHYMGHIYVAITAKLKTLVPELVERANLPAGTNLILFEEIKPNMLERIEDIDKPLEHVLEELMDGDILVFQSELPANHELRLPVCRDYFRDLFYKVDVTFVDKNIPNDHGFTLTLSQRMNYEQIAKAAAEKLDVESDKLQFFKSQNYRELPGHALRCTFEGTLKDLLVLVRPKQPRRLFYQKLSIPIHELENKKQIKCTFLSLDQKDETELTLYPSKAGTVADLLGEAREHENVELNGGPNARLRLLEINSHKISSVVRDDVRIETLTSTQNKTFRIEEVPTQQMRVNDNEILVPVAHFQKEIYSTFGHPFLLKLKEGERFEAVKEKIQRALDVPDKEFEKYRIAVIALGRAKYLDDLPVDNVRIRDFVSSGASGNNAKPYIGLEHINKNSKRPRYTYMEKAIKIYN